MNPPIRLAVILHFFPLLLAVSAADIKPGPIIEVETVAPRAGMSGGAVWNKPAVIRSEADAAKLFAREGVEALKKKIDFKDQFLLLFAWAGSGGDRLEFAVAESFPEQVFFSLKPGRTRDLRQHTRLFALRANVRWSAGGNNQPAAHWTKLYADEAWYKKHRQPEQVFSGTLQAQKGPEVSTLQRGHRYKLGIRFIYPGKEHPELEKLIGKPVEIKGKPYDVELEGQAVSEIWPAEIRPLAALPAAPHK